jgi:hypothetical protein
MGELPGLGDEQACMELDRSTSGLSGILEQFEELMVI